jgi:hypothetical protein
MIKCIVRNVKLHLEILMSRKHNLINFEENYGVNKEIYLNRRDYLLKKWFYKVNQVNVIKEDDMEYTLRDDYNLQFKAFKKARDDD